MCNHPNTHLIEQTTILAINDTVNGRLLVPDGYLCTKCWQRLDKNLNVKKP